MNKKFLIKLSLFLLVIQTLVISSQPSIQKSTDATVIARAPEDLIDVFNLTLSM